VIAQPNMDDGNIKWGIRTFAETALSVHQGSVVPSSSHLPARKRVPEVIRNAARVIASLPVPVLRLLLKSRPSVPAKGLGTINHWRNEGRFPEPSDIAISIRRLHLNHRVSHEDPEVVESYERTSSIRPAGVLATACKQSGSCANTGSPSGDRGTDQRAARERKAGLFGMAERLAVPKKRIQRGVGRLLHRYFFPARSPGIPACSIRESHCGGSAETDPLRHVEGETHPQHFRSHLAQTAHMKLPQSQLYF
jgi:hypothetical protein